LKANIKIIEIVAANIVDIDGVVKIIREFKTACSTRAGRFDPRYGHVPHLYRAVDPRPHALSISPTIRKWVVPSSAVGIIMDSV
jgi:streptogramin lyase